MKNAEPLVATGTPVAEYAIDESLVSRLLEDQHPDLADLPLRRMDEGWDNVIFRLGEHLAVRLPRRASSANLIIHEQRWLPALAKQVTLPLPAPCRVGKPALGFPWPWSVVPWLKGEPADQKVPSPAQATLFGRFLRSLHISAPAEAAVNKVRGVPLRERASLVEARMNRLAARTDLITADISRIWRVAVETPLDRSPTWLHGDLHPRNVLVEQGVITGIIDWGDITAGDCATDLASIWMLFPDPGAWRAALAAYPDASELTVRRAKGWAVLFGVVLLETGLSDNPRNARIGEHILRRVARTT